MPLTIIRHLFRWWINDDPVHWLINASPAINVSKCQVLYHEMELLFLMLRIGGQSNNVTIIYDLNYSLGKYQVINIFGRLEKIYISFFFNNLISKTKNVLPLLHFPKILYELFQHRWTSCVLRVLCYFIAVVMRYLGAVRWYFFLKIITPSTSSFSHGWPSLKLAAGFIGQMPVSDVTGVWITKYTATFRFMLFNKDFPMCYQTIRSKVLIFFVTYIVEFHKSISQ